ncbi:MAG: hypothetical protein Kow0090_12690 [Myxococcota bacterium]
MFGIGHGELLLILFALLILFGAKKLPELGKGLGSGIRQFKEAISGTNEGIVNSLPSQKEGEKKG